MFTTFATFLDPLVNVGCVVEFWRMCTFEAAHARHMLDAAAHGLPSIRPVVPHIQFHLERPRTSPSPLGVHRAKPREECLGAGRACPTGASP
jgi:hypothetical protein